MRNVQLEMYSAGNSTEVPESQYVWQNLWRPRPLQLIALEDIIAGRK